MKKAIPYLIIAILLGWIIYDFKGCQDYSKIRNSDTVFVLKKQIENQTDTVIKWKQAKAKIVYRTKFDTLATIDTVLIELYKADTIIKIDNKIIEAQDSIITEQSLVIGFLECEIDTHKQEIKKQKKKVRLWKIATGISLILNLVH